MKSLPLLILMTCAALMPGTSQASSGGGYAAAPAGARNQIRKLPELPKLPTRFGAGKPFPTGRTQVPPASGIRGLAGKAPNKPAAAHPVLAKPFVQPAQTARNRVSSTAFIGGPAKPAKGPGVINAAGMKRKP